MLDLSVTYSSLGGGFAVFLTEVSLLFCFPFYAVDAKLSYAATAQSASSRAPYVVLFEDGTLQVYMQGRRQRYGRYGHGRTGFLRKKMASL